MDTISDCVATNVVDISDKDELEVYGSDIRTSTQLTSYVFEVGGSNFLLNFLRYNFEEGTLEIHALGIGNKAPFSFKSRFRNFWFKSRFPCLGKKYSLYNNFYFLVSFSEIV